MKITAVILAAGMGTRMRSNLPKVLHPLVGKPIIYYTLQAARHSTSEVPVVVVGHGAETVQKAIHEEARFVVQEQQLGTAHALFCTEKLLKRETDLVVVLSADMPLLTVDVLRKLVNTQRANQGPITMLTVRMPDSHGFGRIVRSTDGKVSHIVEEAQASQKELTIQELNVGAYCIRAEWLWRSLQKIKVSPKGEYYLTDIVQVSVEDGFTVRTIELEDPLEATGINNRVHLAEAETILRRRINTAWMEAGVTLVDPDCTYIEPEVMIASDTTIFPNSHLRGKTSIGPGCQIGPNSIVVDSSVGAKCAIISSMVEGAVIENGVSIGPFSHLRKGAHLHDDVHIGNFGEVKDSVLGPGTKMGHFSYIGNATIGKNVNIGAGTITCNYDGNEKHPTVIGDNVFIGSDSMLVAPVNIGDGARTGAGAVVTHDVQPGEIVVGVPAHPLRNKDKDE